MPDVVCADITGPGKTFIYIIVMAVMRFILENEAEYKKKPTERGLGHHRSQSRRVYTQG